MASTQHTLSQPPSPSLPPELMINILHHVNRKQLWTTCRLVSQTFKDYVTAVDKDLHKRVRQHDLLFSILTLDHPTHFKVSKFSHDTKYVSYKASGESEFERRCAHRMWSRVARDAMSMRRVDRCRASVAQCLGNEHTLRSWEPIVFEACDVRHRGLVIHVSVKHREISFDWRAMMIGAETGHSLIEHCRAEHSVGSSRTFCLLGSAFQWFIHLEGETDPCTEAYEPLADTQM